MKLNTNLLRTASLTKCNEIHSICDTYMANVLQDISLYYAFIDETTDPLISNLIDTVSHTDKTSSTVSTIQAIDNEVLLMKSKLLAVNETLRRVSRCFATGIDGEIERFSNEIQTIYERLTTDVDLLSS